MSVPEIPQYVTAMQPVLTLMVVMSVCATMDTLAMEHTVKVRKYVSTFMCMHAYSIRCLHSCILDIDECAIGNDTCHDNATCTNTDGSFDCDCVRGFMGNGSFCSSKFIATITAHTQHRIVDML